MILRNIKLHRRRQKKKQADEDAVAQRMEPCWSASYSMSRSWLLHFQSSFLREHAWTKVDGSSIWRPATHVGDLDWILGSWLWLGPALVSI